MDDWFNSREWGTFDTKLNMKIRIVSTTASLTLLLILAWPQTECAQSTTINLPPLNGFQPLVIFGATDEEWGGSDFTNLEDSRCLICGSCTSPGR